MPLDKTEVIDLVSLSPDKQTVRLHIIAEEPWSSNGDTALLLQAKLKNYVAFAADGQLVRAYPDVRGKKVVIEIRTNHPLGEIEEKLVALASEAWCRPEGIGLSAQVANRRRCHKAVEAVGRPQTAFRSLTPYRSADGKQCGLTHGYTGLYL